MAVSVEVKVWGLIIDRIEGYLRVNSATRYKKMSQLSVWRHTKKMPKVKDVLLKIPKDRKKGVRSIFLTNTGLLRETSWEGVGCRAQISN